MKQDKNPAEQVGDANRSGAGAVDLSIVVPCFNEADALPHLGERLAAAIGDMKDWTCEAVLVDDGSRDDTWLAIQKLRARYPFVVPVRHIGNRGIVAGWRSGLEASRGRYVVTIDADLQYRPEDIGRLRDALADGTADIAQGARVTELKRTAMRRTLTAGFSEMLNRVFDMSLRDNKSGFLLCRREVWFDILDTRFAYRYFQHLIAVSAHAKGYRIVEVPITFDPRVAGESFITQPLRFATRALRDLPPAIWEFRLARRKRK